MRYPTPEERFGPVLEALGRPTGAAEVARLARAFREASLHPAAIEAEKRCDLSAADHAETKRVICEIAGIDSELGEAVEKSFGDLTTYETHPETVEVINRLSDHGVEIVVISDFHVDLRPAFASLGILDRIAGFAISFEIGRMKPNREMFHAALATICAPAERCLMVGDNPESDCGGVALGIATLILPVVREPQTSGSSGGSGLSPAVSFIQVLA